MGDAAGSDQRMTADALAAATPDARDRFADFLRVASLLGVILGHFAMAVVFLHPTAEPASIEFTTCSSSRRGGGGPRSRFR